MKLHKLANLPTHSIGDITYIDRDALQFALDSEFPKWSIEFAYLNNSVYSCTLSIEDSKRTGVIDFAAGPYCKVPTELRFDILVTAAAAWFGIVPTAVEPAPPMVDPFEDLSIFADAAAETADVTPTGYTRQQPLASVLQQAKEFLSEE